MDDLSDEGVYIIDGLVEKLESRRVYNFWHPIPSKYYRGSSVRIGGFPKGKVEFLQIQAMARGKGRSDPKLGKPVSTSIGFDKKRGVADVRWDGGRIGVMISAELKP